MKKRVVLLVLLILLLAALAGFAIYGDIILDFLFPVKNDWDTDKEGNIYYHNEEGDPVTGWFQLDGKRYYLDAARGGAMHTGWLELSGSTYYLDENGHLITGWQELEGSTYFFTDDGSMARFWLELEGKKHFFREDGTLHTGWLEEGGETWYLDETGVLQTGWLELDGQRYCLNETGALQTGWLEAEEGTYYLNEAGAVQTGWVEADGTQYYLGENGTLFSGWLEEEGNSRYLLGGVPQTGWTELDSKRVYLKEDGTLHTGWLEEGGNTYYLKEDGTPTLGKLVIDEKTHYFTSTGAEIILVNRWNEIAEDYEIELSTLENGRKIATVCFDALNKMVADCAAAGCAPNIIGAYRTMGDQRSLFNTKLNGYQEDGYSYYDAYLRTQRQVAVPGTSEHQLGLAVDILDKHFSSSSKDEKNALVWLSEHCWDYGFIVRYPDEKTDITGIIYESWHFRYVGVELAQELKELGLCLEEYLDMLTGDGTTCGNPALVETEEEEETE